MNLGTKRSHRTAVIAACVALSLVGCDGGIDDVAHDRAVEDARGKAADAGGSPMYNYAYTADQIAHYIGQAPGVEVMEVTGSTKTSDDGVTITVRAHGSAPSALANGLAKTIEVAVCFRLSYASDRDDGEPDEVGCPDGEPMNIPKDPELPSDVRVTIRDILSANPPPTEASAKEAVDQISMDARIERSVTVQKGAIGVALRASQFDCVMARLKDGKVDVWSPSHIQLAPGELSCNANTAAAGAGIQPPH